jgi:aspartyl-tRNA(Asn)/glutamyl-tRNA(Gln) amidotransferase subunit C
MKITQEEVRTIAHIARIAVKEHELDQLAHQLDEILSYAQRVIELAEDVVETPLVSRTENTVRPDIVKNSAVDAVMGVAPETEEGYYVVPKILENNK